MNRKIKFRAWDKGRKEFLSAGHILLAINSKRYPKSTDFYLDVYNEKYKNMWRDRFEIQQFTGIFDKNKREIYEGDIVKIHQFLFDGDEYEKEIIVSVEYIEDAACFGANLLEAKEIKAYMGYDNEFCKEEKVVVPLCHFYGLHDESFEVIGNIFDNPELLNQ